MKQNIGIVGAGLAGRLLALECLQRGWHVTLFDSGNSSGQQSCGWVAAGMIAPYSELESSEPLLFHLGRESLQQWPIILKYLPLPVAFNAAGTVIVAHPQDIGHITRFKQVIHHKLADMFPQVSQEHAIKKLSPKELDHFVPGISPIINEGYWIAEEGQISSTDFFKASSAALQSSDVVWHENTRVNGINPFKITTEQNTYHFDLVCDCRGLGAKQDWSNLRGIRGEIIWLETSEVKMDCSVRLMHPRHPIYISPRPNHLFVVGATSIESEDRSPITVLSMMELLSVAYTLHPGFAEAKIVNMLTQCRPTLKNHSPKITYQDGLLGINGLYRHGYLAGPTVIQEALRLVEHGKAALKYPELFD